MISTSCRALRICSTEYLQVRGAPLTSRLRIVHYEHRPAADQAEPGTYIFASVDRFRGGGLRRLLAWSDALAGRAGVRVWNPPRQTLTRAVLLDRLWRAGRNDFRAVPVGADLSSLRYPVFAREAHTHRGALSPLLHRERDVHAWVGRAVLSGIRSADLLVVEFCDTADADGFYRKYSAFVVGGRVLPRSLEYGRAWMLKRNETEFSPAMAREEYQYVQTNPFGAQLAEIAAIARVDFGRIDYAVKDGRVQTWEVNLNPTIGRGRRPPRHIVRPDIEAIRVQSKQIFYDAFLAAWDAADTTPAGSPLAAAPPVIPRWLWLVRGLRRERWPEHLQRALDPLAPALRPLLAPWLPRVGRRVWQGARARATSAT